MNNPYPAILESKLNAENQKSTLGDPKPENLRFLGTPQTRRVLTQDKPSETIKVMFDVDTEIADAVVISADVYELKYKDKDGCEKTTSVQYKPKGKRWIELTSSHVFKRREDVVDLSCLAEVEFKVTPKEAIPVGKPVTVQVFIGTVPMPKKDDQTQSPQSSCQSESSSR